MKTPVYKSFGQGKGSSVRFGSNELSLLLDAIPQKDAAENPTLAIVLGRLHAARAEALREAGAHRLHVSCHARLGELRLGFFGWSLQSLPDELLELYVRTGDFRSDAKDAWSYGPQGAFAQEEELAVFEKGYQACLFSRKRDAWQMVPDLFETQAQAVHAGLEELDRLRPAYETKRTCPGNMGRDADMEEIGHLSQLPPEPETGEPIGISRVMKHWTPYTARALAGIATLRIQPGQFSTLYNDGWQPARAYWTVRPEEPDAARRHGPFCVVYHDAWAPTVDGGETFRLVEGGSWTDPEKQVHVPAFTTREAVVAYVSKFSYVTMNEGETPGPGLELPIPVPAKAITEDLRTVFS